MPTVDESYSVSPYLLQPLRSYEQALRDRAELSRLRQQALQGLHAQLRTPALAQPAGAE